MEEGTNKQDLGLALSVRRKKFLAFSGTSVHLWLSRARIRVKFPHSYQEHWLTLSCWPTWPLDPQAPTPPSAVALSDSCLSLTVVNSFLFCSGTLPFLVFFRSRRKSRAQALWVCFAPKQTKGSTEWRSLTPTQRMLTIVPHSFGVGKSCLSVLYTSWSTLWKFLVL